MPNRPSSLHPKFINQDSKMRSKGFNLGSRDDVVTFEAMLDSYSIQNLQMPLQHISLVEAYDYLQNRPDGSRVFAAVLDLRINLIFVFGDITSMGAIWNQLFSKGKLEGGSVLDSVIKFNGKMGMHRFNTSFVLRYRALWDKVMGLLLLMQAPQYYEQFMRAKSRKKEFIKIAKANNIGQEVFIEELVDLLTTFDDKFRTSEAHGTGVLRKYAFLMESMIENPQGELIGYWNKLNQFMANYGKIFKIDNVSTLVPNSIRI